MKAWNLMAAMTLGGLAMAAFAANACGDDDSGSGATTTEGAGPGGAGGATSSGPTTGPGSMSISASSTSIASSTGAGGTTGEGICGKDASFQDELIDGCLSNACCDSFDPCFADADCGACLESGPRGPGCDTNALYQAFQTCFSTECPNAICDSTLATPSPNLNACINGSCCASFTPCEQDVACNACLQDPTTAGCDANALFMTYTTCRDASCPSDICGTQIIFAVTYDNGAQDVSYEQNLCAATNCCADLTACADPTGDGFLEMDDPEVAACLNCLQGVAGCPGGAVEAAGTAFTACVNTNCP